MSNMSYCRFQNTANDLEDCLDHMTDQLCKDEHRARARLVKLAREIVEQDDFENVEIIPLLGNEGN